MFGSHQASAAMLAGDEPALTVAGVAVGEIGGLPEDADRAGLLFPFEDALVGDVTAQEIASVPKPHGALGPTQAGGEALDGRQFQPVFLKARIKRVNCSIGITGRALQ